MVVVIKPLSVGECGEEPQWERTGRTTGHRQDIDTLPTILLRGLVDGRLFFLGICILVRLRPDDDADELDCFMGF